jgi:hypothetical protein
MMAMENDSCHPLCARWAGLKRWNSADFTAIRVQPRRARLKKLHSPRLFMRYANSHTVGESAKLGLDATSRPSLRACSKLPDYTLNFYAFHG